MSESNEISLDGFQVVSGDYFNVLTRLQVPSITIWEEGQIGFCKQDLVLLNVCENILVQINSEARKIIIVPTTSKDKDAVCWLKKSDPPEARKLTSKKLTDKLYDTWGWDRTRIYRATGRLVTANNKVMLLFDFSEPESWPRPEARES